MKVDIKSICHLALSPPKVFEVFIFFMAHWVYFVEQINNNKKNKIIMGGMQCCAGLQQNQQLHQYQFEFGEDNSEVNITHIQETIANDKSIQAILNDCADQLKKSSKLYKDPTLKSDPLILKSSNQQDELKCIFHRPYYFLKDQEAGRGKAYKIMDERGSNSSQIFIKNDALQYFSVFLCFLSDNPHLIKNLIITEPNTYGIHAINMYIHGVRVPIYIDDYVLCFKDKPIFSQPIKGVYMWPCLLEKAWQKVKGYGAKKITIASPIEVFQHFLSYPFAIYSLSSIGKEAYRNSLKKNILLLNKNRSYIVTSKKQPHHKIGLSGGKHFYLKCIFEFQGKTIYYLRNPCGQFDFRGFHSILASELQAKIKKETNQTTIAEGNFVLQEDEFLQQIQEFFIVYYNKNSNVVSEEMIENDAESDLYVQIDVEKQQQVSISFAQQQLQGDFPFYPLTYQIISQKQNKIISGQSNEQGCFGVRSTNLLHDTYQILPPGEYLIRLKKKLPKSLKNHSKLKQARDKIIVTGSTQIKIDYSLSQAYRLKFYDFLLQYSKTEFDRNLGGSRFKGKDLEHGCVWLGDLMLIFIRKLNKSKPKINLEVSFPEKVNLQCINYSLKSQYTALQLAENEMLIIFQKRDLTEQTSLGKYFIQTF